MLSLLVNHVLSDSLRRDAIFDGSILLYTQSPSSLALCQHARDMAVAAFAPHEPERAQFALPVEEFVAKAGPLKSRFTNDLRTKELIRDLLTELGCDLRETYFDVPRLRIVPSDAYLTSGVSYAYKAHRDIWYSSPLCQLNYWIPVFPVVPGRAMSFFPSYWDRPLANTSSGFDYGEWCAVGRQMATTQIKEDTRKHPVPTEPVELASEARIAGEMGEMILFSAAHMHATAPNDSGLTRFSLDFRTVNREDLKQQRGAPNVHNGATGTTLGDFLRADDFQPLDLSCL